MPVYRGHRWTAWSARILNLMILIATLAGELVTSGFYSPTKDFHSPNYNFTLPWRLGNLFDRKSRLESQLHSWEPTGSTGTKTRISYPGFI